MKKIGYISLIFLCFICILSPINAQNINQNGISLDDHDGDLFVYKQGAPIGAAVVEVQSGETAHFTVELRAHNSNIPVGNQVISVRLLKIENGQCVEVNVPNFQSKLITSTDGKADLAINTFTLAPGSYGVSAYYAGNQNNPLVETKNKLNSAKSCNGPGLWVSPPDT